MIIDTLDNLKNYVALNPLVQQVVDFLAAHPWEQVADGKHVLGDDAFVNVQTLQAKGRDAAVVEYHRVMTDIQVPISTAETYGYIPVADLPEADYKAEKDMALLPGVASQTFVTVRPGQFVIFTPQDGHAPGIADAPTLRKAIFKIKA